MLLAGSYAPQTLHAVYNTGNIVSPLFHAYNFLILQKWAFLHLFIFFQPFITYTILWSLFSLDTLTNIRHIIFINNIMCIKCIVYIVEQRICLI